MSNLKSFLMFSTIFSMAAVVAFSGVSTAKTVWLEEADFRSTAEGDGEYEPTNFTLTEEEVSLQASAMKPAAQNPVKETVDDNKMPTLTSEGSFLLPTYILPEAESATAKTVASVDDQNPWRNTATTARENATQSATIASAGVALKGIDTPATNSTTSSAGTQDAALLKSIEKQYQDTTALLEATAKRLAALESGVENLNQKAASITPVTSEDNTSGITVTKPVQRAPLLLPLAPIRTVASSEAPTTEESEAAPKQVKTEYVDYILTVISRNASRMNNYSESDELILRSIPKEMKISFLPDSADLSNQAFKWIKVFSFNPKRAAGSAVEVRLSPNNLDLQSRRFALIKGALLANGLAPRQIRFVFTDRDADTVVLRNIQLPEEQEFLYETGKNGKISQQIIQKW